MKYQRLSVMLILFMMLVLTAEAQNPVTYHLTFDDVGAFLEFLPDDWVEQTGFKTVVERKWEIVDGRYSKALHLGASPLKYDDDNMSGLDLDMVTAVIFNLSFFELCLYTNCASAKFYCREHSPLGRHPPEAYFIVDYGRERVCVKSLKTTPTPTPMDIDVGGNFSYQLFSRRLIT